ncbi:hypothetical protein [Companilactobacillus sp. HBUAS59699]|uniref:hypothetical protein n=1 Tax=Companilactobacillus sp. HBUAS59699 TaxID=3109358 RepID=UPI002FF14772
MESAVKMYLAIYRLVHWTTWKTTGFQARSKKEFETGPSADGIVDRRQRNPPSNLLFFDY